MLKAHKTTMLIVDDDLAILRVFKRIFEGNGYAVEVASKGLEAKEKLSVNCYDVALIDLGLPDMEGAELFPFIEKSSAKTVKIVISGKTYLEDRVKKADAFLGKPVDPKALLSIIDRKLSNLEKA